MRSHCHVFSFCLLRLRLCLRLHLCPRLRLQITNLPGIIMTAVMGMDFDKFATDFKLIGPSKHVGAIKRPLNPQHVEKAARVRHSVSHVSVGFATPAFRMLNHDDP